MRSASPASAEKLMENVKPLLNAAQNGQPGQPPFDPRALLQMAGPFLQGLSAQQQQQQQQQGQQAAPFDLGAHAQMAAPFLQNLQQQQPQQPQQTPQPQQQQQQP